MTCRDIEILAEQYSKMLREAPIVDVQPVSTAFNLKTDPKFDQYPDFKGVRNPKYLDFISRKIATKVPYKFKLYFDDVAKQKAGYPKFTKLADKIKPIPGVITAILPLNRQNPVTPWVVGHLLGHAIINTASEDYGKALKQYAIKYYPGDKQTLIGVANFLITGGIYTPELYSIEDFEGTDLTDFLEIFTFKSARDRAVEGSAEIPFELMAQYLFSGKITINPIPNKKVADILASSLERAVRKSLDNAVGKVFTFSTLS